MIKAIGKAIKALKAGQELSNAAGWKNRQTTANAIAAIISFLVVLAKHYWPDLGITDEDIVSLAGGLAVLLGMFNAYVTTATSRKVGLVGKADESVGQ